MTEKEATVLSSTAPSAPDTVQVQEILASSAPTDDRMPEYAVVRKVLKKSCSLPESQLRELMEVRNYPHFNICKLNKPTKKSILLMDLQTT